MMGLLKMVAEEFEKRDLSEVPTETLLEFYILLLEFTSIEDDILYGH